MKPTFEQERERYEKQDDTGKALADTAFERGDRLTDAERRALVHNSRWGSTGYPIAKLGRKWAIDHEAAKGAGLFATKGAAVSAWEILIAFSEIEQLHPQDQLIPEDQETDQGPVKVLHYVPNQTVTASV